MLGVRRGRQWDVLQHRVLQLDPAAGTSLPLLPSGANLALLPFQNLIDKAAVL